MEGTPVGAWVPSFARAKEPSNLKVPATAMTLRGNWADTQEAPAAGERSTPPPPPTIECPLPPQPHEHELLESKRGVNYIRCDRFLSHVYFKSELAKDWLSSHAARPTPNPSAPAAERVVESWGSSSEDREEEHDGSKYTCPKCGTPIAEDQARCGCGEKLEWRDSDSPSEESEEREDDDFPF